MDIKEHQARILKYLHAMTKHYPNSTKFVLEAINDKVQGKQKWPKWCFLPNYYWAKLVQTAYPKIDAKTLEIQVTSLMAMGPWRYTQGIYQVDDDLANALQDSEIKGDLPTDVFKRLPQWSVYVITDGFKWYDDELYGFWAGMGYSTRQNGEELPSIAFLLDCAKRGLEPAGLLLGEFSLDTRIVYPQEEKNIRKKYFHPILSVLMYLCSEEPEISLANEPSITKPKNRLLQPNKKGVERFYPVDKMTVWQVGFDIGRQLREANTRSGDGTTGREVRAHIRRGHWHGYWKGSVKRGDRHFVYYWISPLIVKGLPKNDEADGEGTPQS